MTEKELENLYKKYRPDFLRWAKQNFPQFSVEEHKDVFQDTMIAYYQNVNNKSYKKEENARLSTYIYAIGKNKLLNLHKRRTLQVNWLNTRPFEVEIENESLQKMNIEELTRKLQIIQSLSSEGCYKLLQMYYIYDLDMSTIAEKLQLKNTAVASDKKSACLRKLRERLKEKLNF